MSLDTLRRIDARDAKYFFGRAIMDSDGDVTPESIAPLTDETGFRLDFSSSVPPIYFRFESPGETLVIGAMAETESDDLEECVDHLLCLLWIALHGKWPITLPLSTAVAVRRCVESLRAHLPFSLPPLALTAEEKTEAHVSDLVARAGRLEVEFVYLRRTGSKEANPNESAISIQWKGLPAPIGLADARRSPTLRKELETGALAGVAETPAWARKLTPAFVPWLASLVEKKSVPVYFGTADPARIGSRARLKPLRAVSIESVPSFGFVIRSEKDGSHPRFVSTLLDSHDGSWTNRYAVTSDLRDHDFDEKKGVWTFRPDRAVWAEFLRETHYAAEARGPEAILSAIRNLRRSFSGLGLRVDDFFPRIEAIRGSTRIDFDANEGCRISVRASGEPDETASLPNSPFAEIFRAHEGLNALAPDARDSVVTRTRGAKREAELKTLRHGGLALYLVSHELAARLEGRTIEGGEIGKTKAAEALLDERLGALVFPGENAPLSAKVSKKFCDFLDDFRANLGDELVATAYEGFRGESPPHPCRIEGPVARSIGRIFLARTRAWIRVAEGSFLAATRPKIPDGPAFVSALLDEAIRGVASDEVEMRWNGHKIRELEGDGLRVSLRVGDSLPAITESSSDVDPERGPLDWFSLHPEVFFRGKRVDSSALTETARTGLVFFDGEFYRIPAHALPSLRRLEAFWERLRGRGDGSARGGQGIDRPARVPRAEALELLALARAGVHVEGNPRFDELLCAFSALNEPREFREPKSFVGKLKPYQRAGTGWLLDIRSLGLGGILADDMGLGKTVQVIAFVAELFARAAKTKVRPPRVLLVVPTSLVANWASEFARFAPAIPVAVFDPRAPEAPTPTGVLIATYGLLTHHEERFAPVDSAADAPHWDLAVFDEAQALKNASSARMRVARELRAGMKLALTGTPMENHWGELFSILDLVCPGCLGGRADFSARYLDSNAPAATEVAELRARIRPLVLRRSKREVLSDLPEKIESRVLVAFEKRQKKIYRDTALSWSARVHKEGATGKGEGENQLLMLTALMRLRQICSNPGGVTGIRYSESPPKIEWVVERLENIRESGESGLVFTQFLSTLEALESELRARGFDVASIVGSTPLASRRKILARFSEESGGSRFLIMTLKTGGVGLNLTRANHVIHVDPWWNPAVEHQATDRAHRLGQEKIVQVHRLTMQHSIEEKIAELQNRKQRDFDLLFGMTAEAEDPESLGSVRAKAFRKLSTADFDFLLSTGSA